MSPITSPKAMTVLLRSKPASESIKLIDGFKFL
jgi:hypothetical protein